MKDLFSQCMCVHTCLSCSGMSICTHCLHSRARSETRTSRALTMEVEDREGRWFLTMEDAEDSATDPLQRTCFAELNAEHSRRLATLSKRKQWRQCTKKAKKVRREPDKVQKEKSTSWRIYTSQIYTFVFGSTIALLELTHTALREALCACEILVHYTDIVKCSHCQWAYTLLKFYATKIIMLIGYR